MADAEQRATRTHQRIEQSASVLKDSALDQADSAERRTVLAADRTVLAAERTYAAWVRTGLAALAAGVGARTLLREVVAHPLPTVAGVTLVLFSAFCFVAAVWREVSPALGAPRPEVRRLPSGLLIAINGVLVLVSLAAVYGVLTAH